MDPTQLRVFCDSDSAWSKPSSLSVSTSLTLLGMLHCLGEEQPGKHSSQRNCVSTSTQSAPSFTRLSLTLCREEWEWLQKMASVEEPVPTEPEADRPQNPLFQELQVAIKELMTLVNIPLQEVEAGAKVWGRGRGRGCEHGGAGGCSRWGTACLALLVGLEQPGFSAVQTGGEW